MMRRRNRPEHEAVLAENLVDTIITGTKVSLREKRLSDARNDYAWQTDHELAELDATPVLPVAFPQYVLDYSGLLRYTANHRFSFAVDTLDGKHIGNCTCYDIDETKSEAQLGIIIGDRNFWGKAYGTDAVNALVDYVFRQTKLTRLYLKTLDWNLRAQKCFSKCGFTPCGHAQYESYSFLVMELFRRQWEERRKQDHPETTAGDHPVA